MQQFIFSQSRILIEFVRKHTFEKPFRCTFYKQTFRSYINVETHDCVQNKNRPKSFLKRNVQENKLLFVQKFKNNVE